MSHDVIWDFAKGQKDAAYYSALSKKKVHELKSVMLSIEQAATFGNFSVWIEQSTIGSSTLNHLFSLGFEVKSESREFDNHRTALPEKENITGYLINWKA